MARWATHPDSGERIEACPESPDEALCIVCGGRVILHRRGSTWFWRHAAGVSLTCPARGIPFGDGGKTITEVCERERCPYCGQLLAVD